MGYYTDYVFSIHMPDGTNVPPAVEVAIREERVDGETVSLGCLLDEPPYFSKWYDSESDLRRVSKKYAGILFMLDCTGEDGSRWREYALDGRSQVCESVLTFQPLSPDKWEE